MNKTYSILTLFLLFIFGHSTHAMRLDKAFTRLAPVAIAAGCVGKSFQEYEQAIRKLEEVCIPFSQVIKANPEHEKELTDFVTDFEEVRQKISPDLDIKLYGASSKKTHIVAGVFKGQTGSYNLVFDANRYKDPRIRDTFKGVVAHEFTHVINKDLDVGNVLYSSLRALNGYITGCTIFHPRLRLLTKLVTAPLTSYFSDLIFNLLRLRIHQQREINADLGAVRAGYGNEKLKDCEILAQEEQIRKDLFLNSVDTQWKPLASIYCTIREKTHTHPPATERIATIKKNMARIEEEANKPL